VAGVAPALSFGGSPFYLFFIWLANSSGSNSTKSKMHHCARFNPTEIQLIRPLRHP
jgi:hypothetical protein